MLFCAQAHGALEPGRLCFGCRVQCMEICCHQGPGVYLQSGFPSEGLTLGGFNLIILHFIFSLSHVFLPMCPYISDFFVSEKILCFPFIDFVTLLTVTFFFRCFKIHGQISSVQFSHSVMSDSLLPHESQHTRPPCPSPTPGAHSDSCPSSQ